MNEITRYKPAYIDDCRDPRERVEFETLEELLAIPWVASFSEDLPESEFHRFSVSVNWNNNASLMAEYESGAVWYVVGLLKEPVEGLPEWAAKR